MSRSYLIEVGERLVGVERELERPRPSWAGAGGPEERPIERQSDTETTAEALEKVSREALDTLAKLQAVIRGRRTELEDPPPL